MEKWVKYQHCKKHRAHPLILAPQKQKTHEHKKRRSASHRHRQIPQGNELEEQRDPVVEIRPKVRDHSPHRGNLHRIHSSKKAQAG